MDTASTLCRRFSTMRLAVSGRAMASSLRARLSPEFLRKGERPCGGSRRAAAFRGSVSLCLGQTAAMLINMEKNSPTVSPRTATLIDGLRPRDRIWEDTMYTQPTRAICSKSWEPAGIPAFLMP